MKTALIVVDVQKYFINGSTKHLPARIRAHITGNQYDTILFTKFINTPDSNFSKTFGWYGCASGPDTDIVDELAVFTGGDNVFEKNTFSAFKNRKILSFLRKKGIATVYLCGTDTDACVLSSAFDVFDLGFRIYVLKDLCASCNGTTFHEYGKLIIEKNLESDKTKV